MRVVEEFRSRTGQDPEVVGSAPGRVNLIGEHLDYNGGRALPLALPCRTFVAVAERSDGQVVVDSLQQDGRIELADISEPTEGWSAYVAGVLWALGLGGRGLTLVVDGQVPVGSGLSSSAALEAAVAVAVTDLLGLDAGREDLVKACVRAENDYVGAPTGAMDQTIALLAEPEHALLLDFSDGSRRAVPWHPPGDLVVIDTRAEHALVGGEYAERRRSCQQAAELLGVDHLVEADAEAVETLDDEVLRQRARHVVTEQARVGRAVAAIEDEDWRTFGELLTRSHESLRDDYTESCRELDVAVDAALRAGALGARMTGGGFGGSAIALVPTGGREDVQRSVTAAFDAEGLRLPAFLDGTGGQPARVDVSGPRG